MLNKEVLSKETLMAPWSAACQEWWQQNCRRASGGHPF